MNKSTIIGCNIIVIVVSVLQIIGTFGHTQQAQ